MPTAPGACGGRRVSRRGDGKGRPPSLLVNLDEREGEAVAAHTVQVQQHVGDDVLAVGGEVQVGGEATGRARTALAQGSAALEHEAEVEQPLLAQVAQRVVLRDVEHRGVPAACPGLEVPGHQTDGQLCHGRATSES